MPYSNKIGHLDINNSEAINIIDMHFELCSEAYNLLYGIIVQLEKEIRFATNNRSDKYLFYIKQGYTEQEYTYIMGRYAMSTVSPHNKKLNKLFIDLKSDNQFLKQIPSHTLQELMFIILKDYKMGCEKWIKRYKKLKYKQNKINESIIQEKKTNTKTAKYRKMVKKYSKVAYLTDLSNKKNLQFGIPQKKTSDWRISNLPYKSQNVNRKIFFNNNGTASISLILPPQKPEHNRGQGKVFINVIGDKSRNKDLFRFINKDNTNISFFKIIKKGDRYCVEITTEYSRATNQRGNENLIKGNIGVDINTKDGKILYTSTNKEYGFHQNEVFEQTVDKKMNELKNIQSQISKTKKNSNKNKKLKEQHKQKHKKLANYRKSEISYFVNNLLDEHLQKIIYLEDLSASSMINGASRNNNKELMRQLKRYPPKTTLNIIKTIAEQRGRKVILVNPENTSRTCSKCGHIHGPINGKLFICESCKYEIHRDYNAALNILSKGIKEEKQRKKEVKEIKEIKEIMI